jgi:uncharacterized protein (TIGR03086 family)
VNVVERHRRACDGFSWVAANVPEDRWDSPTPCTEWNGQQLVEHVIGFHDFLLLRPFDVRAHRPREGSSARWNATAQALFSMLEDDAVLDRAAELPGGGESTPRTMIEALTTDVIVHTWDLARGTGVPFDLDPELCATAYEAALVYPMDRESGMVAAEIEVDDDADMTSKLVALYGRDPSWSGAR